MDYQKLYEQAQEEIARLKANDEESLRLTMAQNERFMDEIAQLKDEVARLKDEVIEERKKTIDENEKSQLNDMCWELEARYCESKRWDDIDGPREFMEYIEDVCDSEQDLPEWEKKWTSPYVSDPRCAQDYFDHFDLDKHVGMLEEDWGATTDEDEDEE